jgi:hypothetical protein
MTTNPLCPVCGNSLGNRRNRVLRISGRDYHPGCGRDMLEAEIDAVRGEADLYRNRLAVIVRYGLMPVAFSDDSDLVVLESQFDDSPEAAVVENAGPWGSEDAALDDGVALLKAAGLWEGA